MVKLTRRMQKRMLRMLLCMGIVKEGLIFRFSCSLVQHANLSQNARSPILIN